MMNFIRNTIRTARQKVNDLCVRTAVRTAAVVEDAETRRTAGRNRPRYSPRYGVHLSKHQNFEPKSFNSFAAPMISSGSFPIEIL